MLEDEKVLQAALLQRAVPDLRDRDKVKAVVLLSNGLDLPFSMHIIQVTIGFRGGKKTNNEKQLHYFFQAVSAREGGGVAVGGAVRYVFFSFRLNSSFAPLLSDNFLFYISTYFRQVSLLNSSVPQVGDLCWSSERDSSMQALMRELFYFNYQVIT